MDIITDDTTTNTTTTTTSNVEHAPIAGPLASGTTFSLSLSRCVAYDPSQILKLSPYELFVAQISKSADSPTEARVDAMKKLCIVGDAMGKEDTVKFLIPYLIEQFVTRKNNNTTTTTTAEGGGDAAMDTTTTTSSSTTKGGGVTEEEGDDEDEILLHLAAQLGIMVPGLLSGKSALLLLPILEHLCCVEETVVRDKAVESMCKIVPNLLHLGGDGGGEDNVTVSTAQVASLLLAMTKRLASAEWFPAKVSAAGILPAIYAYWYSFTSGGSGDDVSSMRELRTIFKELSTDDTPMVRRSAAKNLGKFVEAVAGLQQQQQTVSGGVGDNGGGGGGGVGAMKLTTSLTLTTVTTTPSSLPITTTPAMSDVDIRLVAQDMAPLFQSLSTDEQDSVRLLAVCCAGSVGCGLGREGGATSEIVLPIVRRGCADLSWRVRQNLAKVFAPIAGSLGFFDGGGGAGGKYSTQQVEVFQLFADLLQDSEAEVRAAAVENIARMAQLGGGSNYIADSDGNNIGLFQKHIVPLLPSLADDLVMEVRSKLAHSLMDCCDPSICNTLTDEMVLEDFKPLLENFLNDEFAEVQLHILTKLSRISHLLGKMDVVVSSILQMAKAQNWRVREAVGRLLPFLAEARGVTFFQDHLLDPWLKIMSDQVAEVRTACVDGMPKLLSVTGSEWIQTEILPHYTRMYDESHSYLARITVLRCYAALTEKHTHGVGGHQGEPQESTALSAELMKQIVAFMLRGMKDRVPNVRLVAARGLGLVTLSGQYDDATMRTQIVPVLSECMTTETDRDCKYQVQLALDCKV